MKYLNFNGSLLAEDKFNPAFNNRAFLYGDGLFETMVVIKNKILYKEIHFRRLMHGLEALSIKTDTHFNIEALEKQILEVAEVNNKEATARVKLQLWRKTGGLFTPLDNGLDYLISTSEFKLAAQFIENVGFYDKFKIHYSLISQYKTLNALPYVLASIDKEKLTLDDLILFDTDDNIAECCNSTIYFVKDGITLTPSLQTGCVRGILRTVIVDYCRNKNIKLKEGKYKREELLNADYIFTSNITGVSIIKKIGNTNFSINAPIVDEIKKDILSELYY